MRSKAHVSGHPVHPMLIPFPFTFLSGAAAFDLAGRLANRQAWSATGAHMRAAGIASALVAAVPGIIDYFYAVPPRSSGRRRATWHGLANLSAVLLFGAAARLARRRAGRAPALAIGAELAGTALLCAGGWMGGTLVYRNQIGVDPRYAGAGRWNEESFTIDGRDTLLVAREDDLDVDQMKLLRIDGLRIVLARTAAGWSAFEDRCTHKGGSLAGGVAICDTVQCPWHGSQFDVRSGQVRQGPAGEPIRTFPVDVAAGEVRLRTVSLRPAVEAAGARAPLRSAVGGPN